MQLEGAGSKIVEKWREKTGQKKVRSLFLIYKCPLRASTGFEVEQLQQKGGQLLQSEENDISKALLLPSERSMKSLFFSLSYVMYGLFNFKILLFPGNSSATTRRTTNSLSFLNPLSLKPPEQRRTG